MVNKINGLLGITAKAGKMLSGTDLVLEEIIKQALKYLAKQHGYKLRTVEAAVDVNAEQKTKLYKKACERLITFNGLKVAVLGLAFKPGTDDLREAPSLDNVKLLLEQGANIFAFDPVAVDNCLVIDKDGTHVLKFVINNYDGKGLEKEEVMEYLKLRRDMLDAVCISGGEPTCNTDLKDFIKEIKDCKERKNFIIPANRCFDTIVDDRIISANTIHGQFLKYLYSINSFAPHSLSSEIERALQGMDRTELSRNEKPNGNLLRYPVGTVVDIGSHNNSHYFMLGFTTFDSNLTAHASKEEFVLAIQKLIEFCNCHSQGYPVVLPLIGSGLSRMNISKNVALRYIVRAFEINNDIINCDFHIIVWDKDKDNTIITNLK